MPLSTVIEGSLHLDATPLITFSSPSVSILDVCYLEPPRDPAPEAPGNSDDLWVEVVIRDAAALSFAKAALYYIHG
jgi:hypothetical protein